MTLLLAPLFPTGQRLLSPLLSAMSARLIGGMTQGPSRLAITNATDRVLSVSGTIDSHTSAQLLSAVGACDGEGDMTVDLAEVEFIDSSGLRAIVTAHQDVEDGGGRLVLSNSSDSVRRLLEITGLLEHLHLD